MEEGYTMGKVRPIKHPTTDEGPLNNTPRYGVYACMLPTQCPKGRHAGHERGVRHNYCEGKHGDSGCTKLSTSTLVERPPEIRGRLSPCQRSEVTRPGAGLCHGADESFLLARPWPGGTARLNLSLCLVNASHPESPERVYSGWLE